MISADKTKVEYVISAESYEYVINNIRYMAPLEIGIEVAVYMLLYSILDRMKYCVLDINTMTKRKPKST